MSFEPFDLDALRRMVAALPRLSAIDAQTVAEIAQRCSAVMLAAQQAAVDDAHAAYAQVETARDGRDLAYLGEALARWRHALEHARRTSMEVTGALRRMLIEPAVAASGALPHLQAAVAASMVRLADLERRCHAGPGSTVSKRTSATAGGRHRALPAAPSPADHRVVTTAAWR